MCKIKQIGGMVFTEPMKTESDEINDAVHEVLDTVNTFNAYLKDGEKPRCVLEISMSNNEEDKIYKI